MEMKFFKFSLFIAFVLGVLGQTSIVGAYIYDADPNPNLNLAHPFDAAYDYDFKYSKELTPASSQQQANDADEIDNSSYDLFESNQNGLESNKNEKRSSKIYVYRRGCIRRGGACEHRPKDCCFNSSCRCNLWGSNCRCQRMGLFQKWG